MDNMRTVREEARKKGGDALVAKVDAAALKEEALAAKLGEIAAEFSNIEGDDDERKLALVVVNEAFSMAYAKAVVAYGSEDGPAGKISDSQILVLAIRSLVNNVHTALADREAAKGGVADLIKSARPMSEEPKEQEE